MKTDKLKRLWSKTLITTCTYERFTKSSCQSTYFQSKFPGNKKLISK